MGILSGYRVIDLTIAMAGPLAAMRLGDLGADVIKVEPVSGEWQRHTPAGGAAGHQINASFLSLNRNKRSLAVNLKSPEGREIVLDLARRSEVFLQNYRPGVAERLGHGLRVHPRRAPGHRVRVDLRVRRERPVREPAGPGHAAPGDERGHVQRGPGRDPPAPAGTYAVDAITGYGAFEGALAGLLHRERTGEGQLVTVNMLDSAIAVQAQELSIYTVGGIPQHRGPRGPRPRLYPGALRHVRDRGRVPGAGLPAAGPAGRGARHPRVRRDGRRRGRAHPAGRDHRAGPGPAAGAQHGRVAGRVRRPRHLGGPGVRLRRRGRRPAGAAQRVAGQLRPPDRGAGHHARLPVPLQRDPAAGVPRRAAGRRADPRDPRRAGLRRESADR